MLLLVQPLLDSMDWSLWIQKLRPQEVLVTYVQKKHKGFEGFNSLDEVWNSLKFVESLCHPILYCVMHCSRASMLHCMT